MLEATESINSSGLTGFSGDGELQSLLLAAAAAGAPSFGLGLGLEQIGVSGLSSSFAIESGGRREKISWWLEMAGKF